MTTNKSDSSTINDDSFTRIMVYGTLKRGHGNWRYYLKGVEGVEYLGRCYIEGQYAMHDLGGIPAVSHTASEAPQRKIVGEVYRVPEDVLLSLDCLEGHPEWYKREKVETPFKKAWCYFMPQTGEDDIIDNGCWNASKDELEWLKGVPANASV